MCHFFYFVTSLALFSVSYLVIPSASFTCIHDQMASQRSFMAARSIKYKDYLEQRANDYSSYEPLQIHFYLDNFDSSVSSNVLDSIELAARKIKAKIAKTFQVYKRTKPFLLERQSCVQKWQVGKNRGKCSKTKKVKEVCSVKDIEILIPSIFLGDLKVYDFDGDKPTYYASSGPGLMDSNFIIFLTSQSASFCQGTDVSAYGTYCKSDSLTNEPLAGILNLCPEYFKRKIYPLEHYYNVILHEVLHILGFSKNLYGKFSPCRKGDYCYVPRPVIQQDSSGISRMMFPQVIKNMQEHFNCSNADFGGPVAVESSENTTEKAGVGSHWHPVLMYSSVMTPQFSEYDKIFLDSITLAVFESTGWYHVNYSQADNFIFGKGQGCDFGMNNSCENKYLCDPSGNELGCDLVHETFGKCTSMASDHNCGIYRPYGSEECVLEAEKQHGLDFYSLGYKPKCFMMSNPESSGLPSCQPVKCKSQETYEIMINMTWYSCTAEEQITVGNLTFQCPESYLFCDASSTSVPRQFCPLENYFFIAVRLYFSLPTFSDLYGSQNFKNFKVSSLRAIAEEIKIPVNYIVNASLSVFRKVYLDFSICPPDSLDRENLSQILSRTQQFLDSGAFVHTFKGPDKKIISSTDLAIDPADSIAFSDHEGFRALIVFPVLCAIFLLATVIASVLRFLLIQRPQRTKSDKDIQLSDTVASS